MGINIKIARIKKGLSQRELCRLIGIGRTTLSKLENGKGNPNMEVMIKLSKTLDTPIEELLIIN